MAEIERVLDDKKSVTMIQGPAEGIDAIVTAQGIKGAKKLPDVVHDEDEL
jgi:hypothetical protein